MTCRVQFNETKEDMADVIFVDQAESYVSVLLSDSNLPTGECASVTACSPQPDTETHHFFASLSPL